MASQKPDSPNPVAAPEPAPSPRSEALEAELAMLESMLVPESQRPVKPTQTDPAADRGGTP